MKSIFFLSKPLLILALIFSCSIAFSQKEEGEVITITTYYPAPYGVYKELTTTGDTYLATDEGNVGIGTVTPQLPAPNEKRGNLDVNDAFLRGAGDEGEWASQIGFQSRIIQGDFFEVPEWTKIPESKGAAICLLSKLYDDTDHDLGTDFYECEIQYNEEKQQWEYRAPRVKSAVCCGYICLFVE